MGYRNYICTIDKTDYTKLRLLNEQTEEFEDFKHEKTNRLFEIGKYYNRPEGFEIIDDLSDGDTEYVVITKNSLLAIIKDHARRHLDFLNDLVYEKDLTDEDKEFRQLDGKKTVEQYIELEKRKWSEPEIYIYNTCPDSDVIVTSWAFQYEVFELLRIFKSIDDENNYVVFSGG